MTEPGEVTTPTLDQVLAELDECTSRLEVCATQGEYVTSAVRIAERASELLVALRRHTSTRPRQATLDVLEVSSMRVISRFVGGARLADAVSRLSDEAEAQLAEALDDLMAAVMDLHDDVGIKGPYATMEGRVWRDSHDRRKAQHGRIAAAVVQGDPALAPVGLPGAGEPLEHDVLLPADEHASGGPGSTTHSV